VTVDVLSLAAQGLRVPQIAEELGISEARASDLLWAAVRQAAGRALDIAGAREVEVAHLDLLRRTLTPLALAGDVAAARLLVRVSAQRSVLLGLVAPVPEADDSGDEVTDLDRIRALRADRRASSD
jgi:DNA-binding transcriptional regulator YdaS (Cro superfamily)